MGFHKLNDFRVEASFTMPRPAALYKTSKGLIRCTPATPVGFQAEVDGVLYTVVDEAQLRAMGDVVGLETVCTTKVTDMSNLFTDIVTFARDISKWDTSNVTNMTFMFGNGSLGDTRNFNIDISNWDVGRVVSFGAMFRQCIMFNRDISGWNVGSNHSGVSPSSMGGMFNRASSFNQSLNDWDVSNFTTFSGTFFNAENFNQPLDKWDVNKIQNMNDTFSGASSFNQDLSGWCVPSITSKPTGFDTSTSAWVKAGRQPVWGTCPATAPRTITFTENNSLGGIAISAFTDSNRTLYANDSFLLSGSASMSLRDDVYYFTATKYGYQNLYGTFTVAGSALSVNFTMIAE